MNEKKNLREENEIVLTNSKMSQVFSTFFSKAVEEVNYTTMKVMTHFKKHSTNWKITPVF